MPWRASPRILSEQLHPIPEPLALLLRPGAAASPDHVAGRAARALLDLESLAPAPWPPWLAPHQIPAARRLTAIMSRYGGALLADAVGLGKSYMALAVARGVSFALVVPAVLAPQWRALLQRLHLSASIITHERLSSPVPFHFSPPAPVTLFVIDEAHRFRTPTTRRYRALARLLPGAQVLLVTATPVHNRVADLYALFRLFLRDHALVPLGIPSLSRAARGEEAPSESVAVAARLMVARSRPRIQTGYGHGGYPLAFPARGRAEVVRLGSAPEPVIADMLMVVRSLQAGGTAAALFRLTLLRRLASSLAAFGASLERYAAFVDCAVAAARDGRRLSRRDFHALFPRENRDLQLALWPMLLEPGNPSHQFEADRLLVDRLKMIGADHPDPKVAALDRLLHERDGKTIIFTDAEPTARYLLRWLRHHHRVAAVTGRSGSFAGHVARRAEVLAAFAPLAQGAAAAAAALETEILIATDLASEGLNLHDAMRVIHYDVPWNPARLAQRVGRIDRLGSPHRAIETITFLPPDPLARALRIEERLASKVRRQVAAGAAQIETSGGDGGTGAGRLDWCDRLQNLAEAPGRPGGGLWCAVAGAAAGVVLVVRIGEYAEAIVVDERGARADPERATALLVEAARAPERSIDRHALDAAIARAAPLLRDRLAQVAAVRWHAADRDRLSRRLIPWVLSAARRAAKSGDASRLAALDGLVSRLTLGMTAGEEFRLADLLERRDPLTVRNLLAWHRQLPPVDRSDPDPRPIELIAALVVTAAGS